ncbi:SpoVR family protein [bacterium AH-315-E10]|nr:SpoVR family protein [bacterium AH-315-E10]
MRSIKTNAELAFLEKRILHFAEEFDRELPEMRFFILDGIEFSSLLLKKVYPTSPVNIWEGKQMVNTRHRIETGQESSLYYEVVQTGDPSYAYLNENNNAMTQASVMAHVVGHCEFSEMNVMRDSNKDRTETVIFLVNRVNRLRPLMGELNYSTFWNACESITPLISPNSQFNLANSVETDDTPQLVKTVAEEDELSFADSLIYSSTLTNILKDAQQDVNEMVKNELKLKSKQETIRRSGYKLKAPCQDVMGFLKHYAPCSEAERSILDYLYATHYTQDFVVRTQIMNEGWAMHWEKKIMMELFKEKSCKGIIDYAKIFSGVCYPRPYFQRNPYHLGFYMWEHIEEQFQSGKVSIDYMDEVDVIKRSSWNSPDLNRTPLQQMEHIVRTCTDYEFIRRFLTEQLVEKFHLNRIHKSMAQQLNLKPEDIVREEAQFIWIDPQPVKEEMLKFFTHLYQPRIYVIDTDFNEGGLLLYLRDDGRALRENWIEPTMKNINVIWKGPVAILTRDSIHSLSAGVYKKAQVNAPAFETIKVRLSKNEKAFRL